MKERRMLLAALLPALLNCTIDELGWNWFTARHYRRQGDRTVCEQFVVERSHPTPPV